MSDIFEIKSTKIELKIGDRVFEIKDPKFVNKIQMKKEMAELEKSKEALEETDYILRMYDLNKKFIKMFIPEMTEDFLEDNIPSSALDLLTAKISEIADKKFGAIIEKTEKK